MVAATPVSRTNTRRGQYGTANFNARRYPASGIAPSRTTAPSTLREDNHPCHGRIVIQVPGALVLEGHGVIHFNLISRAVDIELLAIRTHAEAEARAARN